MSTHSPLVTKFQCTQCRKFYLYFKHAHHVSSCPNCPYCQHSGILLGSAGTRDLIRNPIMTARSYLNSTEQKLNLSNSKQPR